MAPRRDAPAPPPPPWPSFTGASQYVGTSESGRVVVFVDPSLGPPGLQNAVDLSHDADRIVSFNDQVFGASPVTVDVIVFAMPGAGGAPVTDGSGGADHMGCDYATGGAIEVCASFGASMRCSALLEAELSECNMNGQLCGLSTGEALSRWCALAVSGNALSDFAVAPTWYADGMQNFVDQTDPTDQNPDAIGCAMAFLSWLQAQHFTLAQIAQQMVSLGDSGTLCELYAQLTGQDGGSAWPSFAAAVQALGGVGSDDPFGGGLPLPPPVPAPNPQTASVTLDQAIAYATAGLQAGWPR